MRRLLLLFVVVLGLAPTTWIRPPLPPQSTDTRPILTFVPLAVPARTLGPFRVMGAWSLKSPNMHFGGYSALVSLPDGSLISASDQGRLLRFTPPGRAGHGVRFDYFGSSGRGEKSIADIEGLTRDSLSGEMWAVFEQRNMIMRYDAKMRRTGWIHPPAMHDWPSNTGPEAIVRLGDGRFIVLSEGDPRWLANDMPALLFSSDPVAGKAPLRFRFRPPGGFRAVDAALLPDGRVLVLLRTVHWRLPPRFEGKLMIADPALIREGEQWSGTVVATLTEPLPTDNYEGLAIEPAAGGGAAVWLISDDNRARFQRTLLLELELRPSEMARNPGRASR
jgi:hypothetical protein